MQASPVDPASCYSRVHAKDAMVMCPILDDDDNVLCVSCVDQDSMCPVCSWCIRVHCLITVSFLIFIHSLVQEPLVQLVNALNQGLNQETTLKHPKRDPEHDETYQHER